LIQISIERNLLDLLRGDGGPVLVPIIELELGYSACSIHDMENILLLGCLVVKATYD
jgi:hypothetical protein